MQSEEQGNIATAEGGPTGPEPRVEREAAAQLPLGGQMREGGVGMPMGEMGPTGEAPRGYQPGYDRLDRAVAALDAAMEGMGERPSIAELLNIAQIQSLLAVAGELRSIREAGIGQGDVV